MNSLTLKLLRYGEILAKMMKIHLDVLTSNTNLTRIQAI